MFSLISILIVLVSILIILIVIVQNPKGSGMSGGFSGAASNIIGVQRTGDILEKGTWGSAIVLLVLCILTAFSLPKTTTTKKVKTKTEEAAAKAPVATPKSTTAPFQAPTTPPQQGQQQPTPKQ